MHLFMLLLFFGLAITVALFLAQLALGLLFAILIGLASVPMVIINKFTRKRGE